MTFVSVAQASRRLGIDAKTLHRWLAEAQLALHRHPGDARQKGLSEEDLQALARLHQRCLAPLQEELSLAAARLLLPERLDALAAEVAALQQQVVELTRLLQKHEPEPAPCPVPAKSGRSSKHSPTPPPPAPHWRPATPTRATPPRKPAHVLPRVEYGKEGRYVVICPKEGRLALEADSPAWFVWLAKQSSFRFVGKEGSFSAHHEARVPNGAWRAHRKIRNQGHSLRLAPTPELTLAVLEQAAATLQAHLR